MIFLVILVHTDKIHLSQTNHLFHKKTHNNSYFDCSIGSIQDTLKLTKTDVING